MENKSDLELYEDIANRMQKESDLYVENIISRNNVLIICGLPEIFS